MSANSLRNCIFSSYLANGHDLHIFLNNFLDTEKYYPYSILGFDSTYFVSCYGVYVARFRSAFITRNIDFAPISLAKHTNSVSFKQNST